MSGKLGVLDNLMDKVDSFLVGGGMANTFLVAAGPHGGQEPAREGPRRRGASRSSTTAAEAKDIEILLPTDVVVAKEVTRGAEHKVVKVNKIPNSWSVVDIGPETTEAFTAALEPARTDLLERAAGRLRGARPSATARAPWRASWPCSPTRA